MENYHEIYTALINLVAECHDGFGALLRPSLPAVERAREAAFRAHLRMKSPEGITGELEFTQASIDNHHYGHEQLSGDQRAQWNKELQVMLKQKEICLQELQAAKQSQAIIADEEALKTSNGLDVKHREECGCCAGTGLCSEIDGTESSCMTCNGKGYFEWDASDKEDHGGSLVRDADDLFSRMEGPMFKRQRQLLHKLEGMPLSQDETDDLDGLMNLLDAVADVAHDHYGVDCLFTEDQDNDCGPR